MSRKSRGHNISLTIFNSNVHGNQLYREPRDEKKYTRNMIIFIFYVFVNKMSQKGSYWTVNVQPTEASASPSSLQLLIFLFVLNFLSLVETERPFWTKCCTINGYSTLQVYQRSYSQVGYIPPKMSDSLQRNVRQIWESTPSNYRVFGRTSWVHSEYLVRRESGYLKIFFYISQGEHVKHFVIDVYCIRAKKGSSKVNICHARAQQTFDA